MKTKRTWIWIALGIVIGSSAAALVLILSSSNHPNDFSVEVENDIGETNRDSQTIVRLLHDELTFRNGENAFLRARATSQEPEIDDAMRSLDAAQAEPLYRRALAINENALGPDHPAVAISLNNLGELYRMQGEYASAEPLYKRALVISEQALGPDHTDVATSLNNLALLYHAQGAYD